MDGLRILIAVFDMPEGALLTVSVPMSCAPHRVPARLVLPVVMPAAHDQGGLRPYDLTADLKAARFQAVRDRRSMESTMPNVRYIAREKSPRLAPVGAVIVADLAHAIRVIHACALPPLGVILNAIGLVRHQQGGFHVAQHARDSLVVCRIAAE